MKKLFLAAAAALILGGAGCQLPAANAPAAPVESPAAPAPATSTMAAPVYTGQNLDEAATAIEALEDLGAQ